ncbi:hypothetical protein [Paracidovorax wautersii]|uniref:Uncharacterized protein n=1 Tax=Paracidovorax wautersii TaxID=1177982 RepID=A0A1I2GKK5_9BURK|nr:hypothetical protein [Paracidovorax wautersii]SFF17569.1 hypothetical protein SAMN04489711_11584 [Paracidovorax wautersii]
MTILATATREALRLTSNATVSDFFKILGEAGHDILDGLLATQDARDTAEQSFEKMSSYRLTIVDTLGVAQENFCSISFQGQAAPLLLAVIPERPQESLPTNIENLLSWVILGNMESIHVDWDLTDPERVKSCWRAALAGRAIVAAPKELPAEALRAACAMFGLSHREIAPPQPVPSVLDSATQVKVLASSLSLIQARLLREAWIATHPKWKCLSLYRILENKYLANVRDAFLETFKQDASRAVREAQDSLESELKQLIALVDACDLNQDAVAFNAECDVLLSQNNQFITLLDRGAKDDPLYKSKPESIYKKGVLRLYKLRCSIAHAGTAGVIYEQCPDADQAAIALAPFIERMALKSMQIHL